MEVQADTLREVLGNFATSVTVVTALDGREPQGITVNAFAPVSLEPPLVMVALDRRRFIHPTVEASRRYAVNILGEDQQALSDCFAHAPVKPSREEFCGAAWHHGPTGLPLLDGSLATLECTVVETYPAGDHDMFIGRVDSLDVHRQGIAPLLYFRRHYLRVEESSVSPLEGKPEG
jgi:flavin reductase (DIM6/NTAB) family NADH-FMN oxidoreductase RutF